MKRLIYLTFCIITCMFLMTACGSDSEKDTNIDSNKESTTAAPTKQEEQKSTEAETKNNELSEVPVNDALPSEEEEEEITDTETPAEDSGLTDAQENVAKNPTEEFHGSGTFNGFIDSSSVEVTMTDGTYQTFFVYEETVYNKLMKLSENATETTIQFTYKAREGQVNPEIIAIN